MTASRRLVVDVGTNSVLALLAEVQGDELTVISDRQATTKLGDNLFQNGLLDPVAITRTVKVIRQFVENARYDEILILGTEALRIARNRDEFEARLRHETGLGLSVISGKQEAALTFRGAIQGLKLLSSRCLVIDAGGGSTEVILGSQGTIVRDTSIPIGALRLKSRSKLDSLSSYESLARMEIGNSLADFRPQNDDALVATGGTITALGALHLKLERYDSRMVHGRVLGLDDMKKLAARFESQTGVDRKNLIPFDPDRADLILPGIGIILAILSIIGRRELKISTGGLRFGAALFPQRLKP